MKNLHQNKKHRYVFNREQRVIVHKYFDDELAERLIQKGPLNNKVTKGKWTSKGNIPAISCTLTCQCGGRIYIPDGLPEIFDIWGICSKCGAEH